MPNPQGKIKVYVESGKNFSAPVKYVCRILAQNKKLDIVFVPDKQGADVTIDRSADSNFHVAEAFYTDLFSEKYAYDFYFNPDWQTPGSGRSEPSPAPVRTMVYGENGHPDYFASSFYMINSFQEYGCKSTDALGRFPYTSSYQYMFNNAGLNMVQECFDQMCMQFTGKNSGSVTGQSRVFLSHDIDTVYGAWMEDGLAAVAQGRFLKLFRLFYNAAVGHPDWLNMDKIMKIESEYDFKSAFYWIVNKGGLNADYSLKDACIQKQISAVSEMGFENGLHKSITAETIDAEIRKSGFAPVSNRYHFLKMNLPSAYEEISRSGIKVDSSLGFAEHYGFRNSYGLPFQPYSLKEKKAFGFVEVPLMIMDRTFHSYLKVPVRNTAKTVIDFMEKHNHDCIFSILWHNNFFADVKYRGYLEEYKKILAYLYEKRYKTVNPQEMYNEFFIPDQA